MLAVLAVLVAIDVAAGFLLPILIGYTGGSMIYGIRGGVVGSIATFGAIAGSDLLIAQVNATLPEDNQLGQIHMFIGAMILGPLAALVANDVSRRSSSSLKSPSPTGWSATRTPGVSVRNTSGT